MQDSIEHDALQIIQEIRYMNLSTITPGGRPWGSPVFFAFDKDFNLYWISWKENQHSKNVKLNSAVFSTIYDSTTPIPDGFGVYIQGQALEINNPIVLGKALVIFYLRLGNNLKNIKHFLASAPKRLYQMTPERIWVNGDSKEASQPVDIRREISLDKIKQILRNT